MRAFTVSTDTLRTIAGAMGRVAVAARVTGPTAAPADTGHAGLAEATTAFAAHLDGSWGAQLSATDAVESTLQRTATVYETADGGGAAVPRGATAF